MKGKLSVKDLAYTAMGVALVSVCSWISIPLPVPITMQTFAICLITAVLGLRLGLWTVVIYILLGAAGLPVFSGFSSGLGILLGTTGGYIIGFVFTALAVGLGIKRFGRKPPVLAFFMAIGVLLCYAFGTAWFVLVYTRTSGAIGVMAALGLCVFPYLLPDAAKILLAVSLTGRLHKHLMRREHPC